MVSLDQFCSTTFVTVVETVHKKSHQLMTVVISDRKLEKKDTCKHF